MLNQEFIIRMIEDSDASTDKEIRDSSKWVQKQLSKIGISVNK